MRLTRSLLLAALYPPFIKPLEWNKEDLSRFNLILSVYDISKQNHFIFLTVVSYDHGRIDGLILKRVDAQLLLIPKCSKGSIMSCFYLSAQF